MKTSTTPGPRVLGVLGGLTAAALVLASCTAGETGDASETGDTNETSEASETASEQGVGLTETVTLNFRTDVAFNGTHLPFIYGVASGIYEEYGIDVVINAGSGSASTIQSVSNGADQIGYVDASAMIQAASEGIGIQMVSALVQQSPLAVFALPGSGITEPGELDGTTASYTSGSAPEMLFGAFTEAAGVDADSVTLQNVDIPTRNSIFLAGDVDFTFGLSTSSAASLAAACDCELTQFNYADYGVVALGAGIVVSPDWAAENPAVVTAFLAATEAAEAAVSEDPSLGVDVFFDVATTSTVDPAVLEQQWAATDVLATTEASADLGFGCVADADAEGSLETLATYAGVDTSSLSARELFTNEYIGAGC